MIQIYLNDISGEFESSFVSILAKCRTRDTKKNSDEVQGLRLLIDRISVKLREIDSPHPMEDFKQIAGKASRYFEAHADGRKLSFRQKKNAISFSENRSGMFTMFATDGMTWEEMMSSYDARRLVEQNIDHDKTVWRKFKTISA